MDDHTNGSTLEPHSSAILGYNLGHRPCSEVVEPKLKSPGKPLIKQAKVLTVNEWCCVR